jgi:hypothetical protein
VVQFLSTAHNAGNDAGRRGRTGERSADRRAAVERIGEGDGMTDKPDGKRKLRTRFRALGLLLVLLVVLYMGSYYALAGFEVHAVGDGGDASPFQLMPRLSYREKSDFRARH